MKRICTICARAGSKGVKNKNIISIAGKPLISYSIIQAKMTGLFDAIAVSSDSEAILEVAEKWGADLLIKRPDHLANDTAPKIPAIRHCVTEAEKIADGLYDVIVDLDATSPLRLVSDIEETVRLLEANKVSNVITGAPARRSPYFNLVEIDANGVARLSKELPFQIVRRQDAPRCYDMNASVYVWNREALMTRDSVFYNDTLLFEMPEDRSVDIDSELDLLIVEFLLNRRVVR